MIQVDALPVPLEQPTTREGMAKIMNPRPSTGRAARPRQSISQDRERPADRGPSQRGSSHADKERIGTRQREVPVAEFSIAVQRPNRRRMQWNKARLAKLGLADVDEPALPINVETRQP